jgi:hypothetical protein
VDAGAGAGAGRWAAARAHDDRDLGGDVAPAARRPTRSRRTCRGTYIFHVIIYIMY